MEKPCLFKIVTRTVERDIEVLEFPILEDQGKGYKVWDKDWNNGNGGIRYVSKTKQQYAWPTKIKALEMFKQSRSDEWDRLMLEAGRVSNLITELDIAIRYERKTQEKRRVSEATG